MNHPTRATWILSVVIILAAVANADDQAHLMRWADVHDDVVVFTYEDDLWLVSTSGGDARRITNHPGSERYAKFSPDGSLLAFTAGYDGGTDVYIMDARGGVPSRLSFHPATDKVLGWHPDGDRVLFRSRRAFPIRGEEVYLVSVDGGMPERLPVDRAGLASLSPDGGSLAYNRISREDRTWKRYQGGMAQDLWVGNLEAADFERVTSWTGTDNYPMWQGDSVYFTSDREHGTLNLYRYGVGSGDVTALTSYDDFDVKYPSDGPGVIVYQYGERVWLLDLESGETRVLDIRIGSDRVPVRSVLEGIGSHHGSFRVSADGEALVLEARGEILAIPSDDDEEARNLTETSGSREKDGVPSPDGKYIALNSDRSGQEELWLVTTDGEPEWRQITDDGVFNLQPVWSPDGAHLLWSDKEMRLNLLTVETGAIKVVDQGRVDDAWERWGIQDYVWSPDGRWIAYSKMEASLYEAIFIYSMEENSTHRITDHIYQDWSPSFSTDGRYLFFLSNRSFNPVMGFVDQNHIFLDMGLPYVVILRADEPSPFAPGTVESEDESEEAEDVVVEIDFDGIEARIVAAKGVEPGNYFRLEAIADGFVYLAKTEPEFLKYQAVDDHSGGKLELWGYSLEEASSEKFMDGIANYHLSVDGEMLVYCAGSKYGIVDAGASADVGDGAVSLKDVRVRVDRKQEFQQIFAEAWRIQRDWFYDPGMHGVDWQAVFDKYQPLVASCGSRSDLNYLIGEMIAELNTGHTYIFGGDHGDRPKRVRVGLLGADFDTAGGAAYHRIMHVIPGLNWQTSSSERSPMATPGCGVSDGDYLISIDGIEVSSTDNLFAHLEDKVGRPVRIGTNDVPSSEGVSFCRVEPIGSELVLRRREWVERNRAAVDEASGGTIGYLYLPAMMQNGLIEFARAFYPDHAKKAFVIDERYNGGGFVGDMIIDRLERQLWSFTKPREGAVLRDPERAFYGHLAVLVNEDTGSNGEYFAEAIKIKGLATVIGMRTWGGAVGIEPHQDFVDGGGTTPPQFGLFDFEGRWLIEGHGVEPDIEVQNEPGDVLAGRDAQLEAALQYLSDRLASDPMDVPETPPDYPNKAKASIAR